MNAAQNTKSVNKSSSVKVWSQPQLSVVQAREAQQIDGGGIPVGFDSKS